MSTSMISYEHPLNERIRTLLRLEDLYDRVARFAGREEAADHHVALLSLFEVLEVASRADLKSDLLQELERQKQSLESLRYNPAISEAALDDVLAQIDRATTRLLALSGKIGQHLRDNEWLMAIKQRAALPGGVCEFDLPSYHYWLHLPADERRRDLEGWLTPFLPIQEGLAIVLHILRDSGRASRQVAHGGSFQQMQGGRLAQMLCVRFDRESRCIPEISANKYALNIRFTLQSPGQRPKGCETDVEFDLIYYNL